MTRRSIPGGQGRPPLPVPNFQLSTFHIQPALGGRSNRQPAGAGCDGPGFHDPAVPHRMHFALQRDGGADVAGNAVERGADGKLSRPGRFEDEVFLAVIDENRVVDAEQGNPRMRHFTGDGFVAEIEAEMIGRRPADDTGEKHGGM